MSLEEEEEEEEVVVEKEEVDLLSHPHEFSSRHTLTLQISRGS